MRIVLSEGYEPPTPLREVAANRSVDELAPKDPVAAEMAQIREALEEIRGKLPARRTVAITGEIAADISALRRVVERNIAYLDGTDFEILQSMETSSAQDKWVKKLQESWGKGHPAAESPDPWAKDASGYSDEPPF